MAKLWNKLFPKGKNPVSEPKEKIPLRIRLGIFKKSDIKKTVEVINESVIKPRATQLAKVVNPKYWMEARKMVKSLGPKKLIGLGVLSLFMMRTLGHIVHGPVQSKNTTIWAAPGSTYTPEHYSKGYDTITQSLTDFGSKVHLEKLMKTITPMITSTRKGTIRTTGSIINNNLALTLNKNAIGHWRY